MMSHGLLTVTLLVSLVTMPGPAVAADPIKGDAVLGTWLTGAEGKELVKVVIALEEGEFIGRIVWLKYPRFRPSDESGMEGKPKIDLKNPDPDLRDRPALGMAILEGFQFKPEKKWPWIGGTVYDPEKGKTYSARMKLEDSNILRIKGYVLIPLFGRSTIWTRVSQDQ